MNTRRILDQWKAVLVQEKQSDTQQLSRQLPTGLENIDHISEMLFNALNLGGLHTSKCASGISAEW